MKTAQAYASAKKEGIRVSLWSDDLHSTAIISVREAEELIRHLRKAIDEMPRVASAADLGMEVA